MSKWKQNKGKANGNAQKGGAVMRPQNGGMISETDKYNERHGKRKVQETMPPVTVQAQPVSAQSVPAYPTLYDEQPKQSVQQPVQQAQPVKEPEAKQPERKPQQEPTWESKVDNCLDQLTRLTSGHHKTLDDHGRRLRKLERWQEKDEAFAKKAAPVIAELQRDKELSDERLEELEEQFWAIWAHHLGVEPAEEPEVKVAEKKLDPKPEIDDVKTVDDLVDMEAASKSAVKSDPVPALESEPATKLEGKPKLIFKYWDFRTRSYGLTADIWAAKQIDDDYDPIWAWYVDDAIDHLMDADEIRKYCP